MGTGAPLTRRRAWLAAAGAGLALPWLAGCRDGTAPALAGGWVGANAALGHRLRAPDVVGVPDVQRRVAVVVVGAGIAGLAAARALDRACVDDVHLLELEDAAGGNSRGHRIGDVGCPLGAHYLPVPGPAAIEVAAWLEELGLSRQAHGRTVYDERHLCHSPQERLFVDGAWHDGLLPPAPRGSTTQAQYRRFAQAVAETQRTLAFAMPTLRAAWTPAHAALDAQTFDAWLDARGLADPRLRWHLDYCCRDDYGAGSATVSAWAGLHYFASRHGFHAPGDDDGGERDAVLTWPEGNAFLVERLARPFRAGRLHTGRLALRVREGRHEASVDVLDAATGRTERWTARQAVLAVPLFIAARLLEAPPAALVAAAARQRHAPWLVANLALGAELVDRPGAAPSWDNVLAPPEPASAIAGPSLGYVDASHQSLRPDAGARVLTAYWALPESMRGPLLAEPWTTWTGRVVADLARAHPDLPRKLVRADLMRYGHAMSIPAPGVRGGAALRALGRRAGPVHFAHADLSGYSVFEEAFTWGAEVGARSAAMLGRAG